MSTARFTVCVSALTPFAYHAFRVRVTLLPLGEQLAHVDVARVDPYRAVDQPIDHRIGPYSAAEPAVPFRGRVLRADDRRFRRVAPLDQLEQEADVDIVDVLRQPLVDGQELVARASDGSWAPQLKIRAPGFVGWMLSGARSSNATCPRKRCTRALGVMHMSRQ